MIVENPMKPEVNQKVCTCRLCAPVTQEIEGRVVVVQPPRLHHWFCCLCQKGPYQYGKRNPYFIKNWYASGTNVGSAHYACSEPCRVEYLRLLEHGPVRAEMAAESLVPSTRDERAPDSD